MSQSESKAETNVQDYDFPLCFPELDDEYFVKDPYMNLPQQRTFHLRITEEPQSEYKFRFRSQAKVFLHGRSKAKAKRRNFPTVELLVEGPNGGDEDQYFIRCGLYQEDSSSSLGHTDIDSISPHRLQCRLNDNNQTFTNETDFFPCYKKSKNKYELLLENFIIFSTPRKNWPDMLEYKLMEKLRQDLKIPNDDDLSEIQKSSIDTKIHQYSKKSHYKVRLGFDAFRQEDDGTFTHIAGPVFSKSIANGLCPHIKTVCNKHHLMNGRSEMTLLITEVKSSDKIWISELISPEDNGDGTTWQTEIKVENDMIHEDASVTFQMPHYGGANNTGNDIKCEIQLERFSDGARSNKMHFFYTHRRNTLGN